MRVLELVRRGLVAQRRSALIWGAVLVLLAGSVLAMWPSLSDSGSLDSLSAGVPHEVAVALGLADLASPAGFLDGNLTAVLLPVLLGAIAIVHMQTLTAGDEDAGRLELLLALPVSRTSVYLARFASVALVLVAIATLVGLTIGLGAQAFDMQLRTEGVVAVTASLLLLALLHAGLVTALAGLGMRGTLVLAVAFGVLALGYLAHSLLPMVEALEPLAESSPWHWALGAQPLTDGFDAGGMLLLAGGCALLVVVGLLGIRRRTIRTA